MVQTAQTNVAYTVTAVTDLMGTVNLDVRLDGREGHVKMVQKDYIEYKCILIYIYIERFLLLV